MRTCRMCGIEKPLSNFLTFKRHGKLHYRGKCRPCFSAHRKSNWSRRKPKQKCTRDYRGRKNHPCVDCGKTFPSCAMQFDHVRGEKVDKVSNLVNAPRLLLEAEIAKCDLVCGNCHKIRTHTRRVGQTSEAHPS